MKTSKLGMAQIRVEGGEVEGNLTRAVAAVRESAERGCDAVLLPECLDIGWTHPSAQELAQPIPGAHSERLAEAAREAGIYVVAGLTERAGNRLYNTAVFLSPDGEILLKHRKLNELDFARKLYTTGDFLGVAETPMGTVGIPICADNWPSSLVFGHALGRMGARLILSPCAWAVPPGYDPVARPYGGEWLEAYSTLAKAYGMAVVGVSNVGRMTGGAWSGHSCIGRSLAVGSDGQVLAHLPFGKDAECLEVCEIAVSS